MSRAEARPVRIAVIGAGAWGRNHVRSFASLEGAELRCVCDRSERARSWMKVEFPGVPTEPEVRRVVDSPEVEAVVVATDAPTHHVIALAALEAGKDVLVEKPLALTARDAEELCRVADARQRILMVGHLLLYHPAIEALRCLVSEGALGDLHYLYAQRLNLGVVRRDENAWWSLAPHDLSLASHLFDAAPESVSATGGVFLQQARAVEDVVFATVRYQGGRLAHVHVSWLDPHKTRRLTVVGARKMAVFDDTSPDQKLTVYDKGVEPPAAATYSEGVRIRTGDIHIPALRMSEPLRREAEDFLRAVRTRARPRADGRSGLAVVRALEAGALSLAEGGRSVSLDEVSL